MTSEQNPQKSDFEKALRESQVRFEAVSSITPDAIILADEQQRITFFNKGAEQIFGYQASEIIAQPLDLLMPVRYVKSHRAHVQKFSGGGEESRLMGERQVNIFGRRKDGSEFPAAVSISRWKKNGETVFAAILRDVTEQKYMEESLRRLAYYDSLTGLPNRQLYHDLLEKSIVQAQREEKSVAVLLLDLDQFKEINDTLGHHRGDVLLQRVGERLKNGIFGQDISARLGGDEFGLVLMMSSPEHAGLVADKIIGLLKEPFEIEGLPVIVEAAIGIALCPEHGANADILMQRADVAMYVSKKEKSGYVLYDPVQDKHSPKRLALMGELRHAIGSGQLSLVYQPKIDLRSRKLSGVEALIRWKHPKFGPVPPEQFILPAEQTGLIHPLTQFVLRSALLQGQIWRQMGMTIPIGINVSARNLENPDFSAEVGEIAESFGIDPGLINLEITESAFMTSVERAVQTIHLLNQKGFHFSIDDFGTGNTSLSYLKKLAVKAIKIDRSFVKDMLTNEDDLSIVTATIDLAYRLNLRVVAEGVEDQVTLERLADLGCDEAQGFHISQPLAVEDFDRWLAESPWGGM